MMIVWLALVVRALLASWDIGKMLKGFAHCARFQTVMIALRALVQPVQHARWDIGQIVVVVFVQFVLVIVLVAQTLQHVLNASQDSGRME